MANEKNQANAKKLLALADAYALAQEDLPEPVLVHCVFNKQALLDRMRALGGSWRKEIPKWDEGSFHLISQAFPLTISIPRDKVCRKNVTWECEPLFSPADEQEIDAALIPGQDEHPSPVQEVPELL